MFSSAPIVEIWGKNVSHKWLFSTFLHFSPWKQHKTGWFQHSYKGKRRGYNHCIVGNVTQKEKCIPWKGQWHWQTTKVCLYIHICIYRHLYRSLLSQSSRIQAHSCRNLWGIKKAQHCTSTLWTSTPHISLLFSDLLLIFNYFSLITILGNMHRPCKLYFNIINKSPLFFLISFLIFSLYLHYLPY